VVADNQQPLILYSTLGCHLCDEAKAIIDALSAEACKGYQEVDIADSDDLVQAFGIRIPVLFCPATQFDLGWPFDQAQLADWLVKVGRVDGC